MLVKYPGLALAGVSGIAVAVAIAAGAFSLIYGNFLTTAVPLDEGDRLVSIELWDASANKPETRLLRDFTIWRDQLKSVQNTGAFRVTTPNLIAPGAPPESVRVAAITASGFDAARVRPLVGRHLTAADERDGAPPVVVIGETVWRNRFGANPAILGQTLQLGATPHTIVGVMPKSFAFPVNDQLWIPLRAGFATAEPLTGPSLMVFGRLAPGATLESTQAELSTLGQRTAQTFPEIYTRLTPRVMPYPRPFAGIHGPMDATGLLAMQGIFVALLVLVCLNVTILVYTRTAMRQAELRLRTALGASRARIVAQLFAEALVLSSVAAIAGVGLAALGLRWLAEATLPLAARLPFWVSFQLTPESVAYAVALSILAAVIVGVLPALQATGANLPTGFRIADSGGIRLGRIWTVLIIAQVGFAVALLPPAVASAWNDARDGLAGVGFPAEQYLSAELGTDTAPDPARQTELLRRLEAEPGVSIVTYSSRLPGDESGGRMEPENSAGQEAREVRINRVALNFFRAFEVPVLAGRTFEPGDPSTAVVINLRMAQNLFGGNALGRRIRYVTNSRETSERPWHEVIGVVPDFPNGASPGMRDPEQWKVYHLAAPGELQPVALSIRLRGNTPAGFSQRLREITTALDPNLHLREICALDEVMRSEQWISRMTAAVFAAVTLSVLLLSAAGIYALMAFTVAQRRKEIGIRIALGAAGSRIVAGIFSRALWQLGSGMAIGALLGLAAEQASGGVLLRGNAAIVVPGVSLIILAVGLLAALGPARRSLRIDPTEALREQ